MTPLYDKRKPRLYIHRAYFENHCSIAIGIIKHFPFAPYSNAVRKSCKIFVTIYNLKLKARICSEWKGFVALPPRYRALEPTVPAPLRMLRNCSPTCLRTAWSTPKQHTSVFQTCDQSSVLLTLSKCDHTFKLDI